MTLATLSALSEPTRFNIIELLRDYGALTVSEIAQKLGLRLPQSSKHLHVLAKAGLVKRLTRIAASIHCARRRLSR